MVATRGRMEIVREMARKVSGYETVEGNRERRSEWPTMKFPFWIRIKHDSYSCLPEAYVILLWDRSPLRYSPLCPQILFSSVDVVLMTFTPVTRPPTSPKKVTNKHILISDLKYVKRFQMRSVKFLRDRT
jgi:hypothetical protein